MVKKTLSAVWRMRPALVSFFVLLVVCLGSLMAGLSVSAYADDLDGLSTPTPTQGVTQQQQQPAPAPQQGNNNVPLNDVIGNGNGQPNQLPTPNINNPSESTPIKLPKSNPGDVGDFIKGYNPVNKGALNTANNALSPVMKAVSYIVSGTIIVTIALIFLITVIDLVYIAVPPVRGLLYTPNTSGTGSMLGAGNNNGKRSLGGIQLVSDEAVKAAALMGGETPTQGSQMRMGGFGGYGGGPMMSQQQNKAESRGSVIGTYFRSRIWFMFVFGIAVVLLTSSIFTDWGINVGGMVITWLSELKSN